MNLLTPLIKFLIFMQMDQPELVQMLQLLLQCGNKTTIVIESKGSIKVTKEAYCDGHKSSKRLTHKIE